MNTGFKCPCGNRRTYAKLKRGFNAYISVVVFCKKCGREVQSDIDFLDCYGENDLLSGKIVKDAWDFTPIGGDSNSSQH
jgi:hypothetical protein